MPDYTKSRVLSLRIDPELVDAVRERARPAKPKKISGWLARREAPATHAEFQAGRVGASEQVAAAVAKKARFDRITVAAARATRHPLLAADSLIEESGLVETIWD